MAINALFILQRLTTQCKNHAVLVSKLSRNALETNICETRCSKYTTFF